MAELLYTHKTLNCKSIDFLIVFTKGITISSVFVQVKNFLQLKFVKLKKRLYDVLMN